MPKVPKNAIIRGGDYKMYVFVRVCVFLFMFICGCVIMWYHKGFNQLADTLSSELANHHLSLPDDPESASHNWCLNTDQCNCTWEGGKGSPDCCPREEGQHRRKVQVSITHSSGNNKCLRKLIGDWVGWFGLTSMEGRAAQAWPCLLSWSPGSSSTKPATLYLQVFSIFWLHQQNSFIFVFSSFFAHDRKILLLPCDMAVVPTTNQDDAFLVGDPTWSNSAAPQCKCWRTTWEGEECFELSPL